MELSVSGFPEPSRQSSSDSDQEPSKLRGLFAKKAETRLADSRSSTRPNTEEFIHPSASSSSLISSPGTHIDDHDAYAQMVLSSQEPLPPTFQRPRKVSIPRKAPQITKKTSFGRLEIGSRSRTVSGGPAGNALSTPPASTSTKNMESTPSPRRPLPLVPSTSPIAESNKSSTSRPVGPPQKPPSSILISKPSRPRAHTTSLSPVSVRYQSLVVDFDAKDSQASSPHITGSSGGKIRRLPAIPASTLNPSLHGSRHAPRPRARRTSTSSGPSNSLHHKDRRSPFDTIPTSWASRPVDLNPTQRAQSPSQVASSSNRSPSSSRAPPCIQVAPRSRSYSRPRREPSEDPPSRTPISASPRHTRILASVSSASTSSSSPSRTSAGTSSLLTPPHSSAILPLPTSNANRFLSTYPDSVVPPPSAHSKFVKEASVTDPSNAVGIPTHSFPAERLNTTRDHVSSLEIPSDIYIDDEDHASVMSRSPSPMRYARPNSRGSLSDDSSDYSRSRSRAVRDQLRSYRRSYRGPKSPSRSPSPIQYARRKSLDGLDEVTASMSPKRREQPRSYQFDYKAAQDSSPFIAAFPQGGKSSDNLSKTNSSNSSSVRMPRGRSKGSKHSRASRSRSPRWPKFSSPAGSVIDITIPSTPEQQHPDYPSFEHRRTSRSVSHLNPRGSLSASASGSGTPWKTAAGGSWEEVSTVGKKRWIDMYNRDSAVVVTTIKPTKDVWKEEDMKRIIPKLRDLKARS